MHFYCPFRINILLSVAICFQILHYGYTDDSNTRLSLKMPGAIPTQDDQYICTNIFVPRHEGGKKATSGSPDDWYIMKFEPHADMNVAHHMMLFGCKEPFSYRDYYECNAICSDNSEKIFYAWARQASELQLPKEVSFHIGGDSGVGSLILQIHYLKKRSKPDFSGLDLILSKQPTKLAAGMFLVNGYVGKIPPKRDHVHIDASCKIEAEQMVPFAFRTHAHAISRSIVAYHISVRTREIREIGKGNPQWPQAFYPTNKGIVIQKGDYVLGRCVYDSMNRSRVTEIGPTHNDEMCNFYIMYYVPRALQKNPAMVMCGGNRYSELWESIPKSSLEYAPDNPPNFNFTQRVTTTPTKLPEKKNQLKWLKSWSVNANLGQIGGLDVDNNNHLVVLHRGNVTWDVHTFNDKNIFVGSTTSKNGLPSTIADNVLLKIHPNSGQVINSWGAALFYLPHGVFVDRYRGDVWVTDVGAHQVMRFKKGSWDHPDLILGERLVPGIDEKHFCQPADVVVNKKGEIFVADGYCNSRIMKFSPEGKYIKSWGSHSGSGDFEVVHSLTIIESRGIICAADRERAAIECFTFDGVFNKRLQDELFGSSVYSIVWNEKQKLLYGVSGPGYMRVPEKPHIFAVDLSSGKAKPTTWGKSFLTRPHDIAISPDSASFYVGQLSTPKVLKFHVTGQEETVIKISRVPKLINRVTTILKRAVSSNAPVLIGLSLIIPVAVILCIVLLCRCCRSGTCPCCPQRGPRNRRYGPLFKERSGFQPLNQDESDVETEQLTKDSDSLKATA